MVTSGQCIRRQNDSGGMVCLTEKLYEISRQREAYRVDVDCLLYKRINKYYDGAVWVIDDYEQFLRGCGIDDLSRKARKLTPFWRVVIRGVVS